jgi:hypothetical protein
MSGDNSHQEWVPLLSSARSPTTTQSAGEPGSAPPDSRRSMTIVPLTAIACPAGSAVLFTETSAAFELSNATRRTT